MFLAWVIFPLVVAATGAGWGVLVERLAGRRYCGALLIPLGLAAVTVVAGTITVPSATAPAAIPICGAGAVVGLVWGRPWRRISLWPALLAVGVILAYGAPVLLYGHPSWAGYLRLDDTATWFNVVDNVMAHGRSVAGLPSSTYSLIMTGDVGAAYPLGAFMDLGVTHALAGQDVAWTFAPYLAWCGAALGLCVYALAEPLIATPWRRATVAFLAAQPALLYGYGLWGGIKELTSAWLVALGAALVVPLIRARPARGRELLGLAVAAGALTSTLSVGAAGWMAPALVLVLGGWLWTSRRGRRAGWWRAPAISTAWLVGLTAVCAVPLWAVISTFLSHDQGLFNAGQDTATRMGNLIQPLSGFQLAGVWTIGDFRLTAPVFPTAPLVGLMIAAALVAIGHTVWRRQFGLLAYAAIALFSVAVFWLAGSTPWVMGKALAISSPALPAVALIGAGMLWSRHRWGVVLLAVLAVGVLWSNVRGYHDALLAPYQRMNELAHIGGLVGGQGPTLINDYEVYADRHFERAGAPTEPAEYRPANLPTTRGALLVKTAYADLDSFSPSTLYPYRSIVVRNSPVESRPPSIYRLVYSGSYYELFQRPAVPRQRILLHLPLGDQDAYPYCGAAENGPTLPLCSIAPASVPVCSEVQRLARLAESSGGWLMAYQRPLPVVIRGDDVQWPGEWIHDDVGHSLTANTPGTALAHIVLPNSQRYELWLGGLFARGFQVAVDGRPLGLVANQIFDIDGYVPVAGLNLRAGVHTVAITYPSAGLGPGSGDNGYTTLDEIALQPVEHPAVQMLRVSPSQAGTLCGRPLDWIEVVAPSVS